MPSPLFTFKGVNKVMQLRVVHVSDTHGRLPLLSGRADVVVHSGDWAPNRHDEDDPHKDGTLYAKPDREEEFQAEWFDKSAKDIAEWLNGRPLIYCPGNHCFHDPTARLRAEGIDFVNLGVQRLYEYTENIPFFGFPFCPQDVHPWNYALGGEAMAREIERMRAILEDKRQIMLVAHCPPGGILDKGRAGTGYGNTQLASFLSYSSVDVKAVLCGHIHADHGVFFDTDAHLIISNAATAVHNLVFEF